MLLKLQPSLVPKVWGGQKLKKYKRLGSFDSSQGELGETWEISCHPDGESLHHDCRLSEFIDSQRLPYLVKLIDTSDNLSVQVHPDDEYAQEHESSRGKTESWFILDSDDGSGIYLGLKDGVLKQDVEKALASEDDISQLLKFYPVKNGDFFYVPAGTIHAIGKGVTLAEIQQSSGITYRVWDWNRLGVDGKPRELHVRKSLDVINFESAKNNESYFKHNNYERLKGEDQLIVEHPEFKVEYCTKKENKISKDSSRNYYHSIMNYDEPISIEANGDLYTLEPYEACLFDLDDSIVVRSIHQNCRYLHIY